MSRWFGSRAGRIAATLAAGALLAACGGTAPAGAGTTSCTQPMKLRLADEVPPASTMATSEDAFAKDVEKDTKGCVTIQNFHAGQLYKDVDAVQAISQRGLLDMAVPNGGVLATVIPSLQALDLPYLIYPDTPARWSQVMAANAPLPKAANAQAAKKGIVIATYRFVGHIVLSSKTPIKSWQDIQRKKVRTWDGGPIAEATVKALGGQPAFDPAPATAGDLQSGVLDQAFGSLQFAGVSLSDSARYSVYADGLAGVAQAFVVNEQLWNSLSAAFRDVITKDAKKELVDGFYSANDAAEQKAIQAITSKGGSVDHLSDADVRQMRSRTAPVWRQFRNTIGGGLMDQLKQP